jgi:hypothetical protein
MVQNWFGGHHWYETKETPRAVMLPLCCCLFSIPASHYSFLSPVIIIIIISIAGS